MNAETKALSKMMLIGLTIRLILAPITAHPSDVLGWFRWAQLVGTGLFPPTYYPPYPLAYVLWPFAMLFDILQHQFNIAPIPISAIPQALQLPPIWGVDLVPPPLFDFIIKIPFMISDVLVGLLIFQFVSGLANRDIALRASTLWILNPITIWVSSAWGMFDTLPALFVMAMLLLIQREKPFLAGIAFVIAFAFKLYPALFIVPLILFKFPSPTLRGRVSPKLAFALGASVTAVALYLPFTSQAISYFGGAVFSRNFFYLPTLPTGYGLTYWSLSSISGAIGDLVGLSSVIVLVLQLVSYAIFIRREQTDLTGLTEMMLAVILSLFLGFRFIGANFVVWIIPMMAILVSIGKLRARLFWSISCLAFLFSITDSLLPYYFLPISPWIGGTLATSIQIVQPYRIMANGTFHPALSVGTVVIGSMGVTGSALFALAYIRTISLGRVKQLHPEL